MYLVEVKTLLDVDIIMGFYHSVFPEEPNYDGVDFKNSVTGNHKYKRLIYYIVYEGSSIVGFCGLYSNKDDECWLGWFGVKPEYQGCGYGKTVLFLLEKKMLELGYRYGRLYTDKNLNNRAYQMYIKHGWIEDSQYEYDFVTMVKDLTGVSVVKEKYWKEPTPLGFESEPPHHCS